MSEYSVRWSCVLVCCAASYYQGSVHSPYSFCLFILANMAGEELAELAVGNDSGMYKAGFPGDDAPRAEKSGIAHSTTTNSGLRLKNIPFCPRAHDADHV